MGSKSVADTIKPVFLLGATAAGKTALAMELAQRMPFEIISVDSALIYRSMDIGTAKPTPEELRSAPHRLIDIIDPWEQYSVSRFIVDAKKAISEIVSQGRIPLLTGGTMMYYKALQQGLTDMPSANAELRTELDNKAAAMGWQGMHEELEKIDPDSAARIHPNDPQRIQRALEVYYASGITMTEWHQDSASSEQIDAIMFGLFPEDRQLLHDRIALRFDLMLEQGFIEEVERLKSNPLISSELPSMRCVGYRQVWQYLEGMDSREDMREKGVAATRQLAKRQITWMRKMPGLMRLDSSSLSTAQMTEMILAAVKNQK